MSGEPAPGPVSRSSAIAPEHASCGSRPATPGARSTCGSWPSPIRGWFRAVPLGPPRCRAQWNDFAVVVPHTEFDDTLTLPGGVEVRHVGGGHAEDSTVVAVPDSG